jgi:hypothetical protein
MAPRATNQSQKAIALTLFNLLKSYLRVSIQNKIQQKHQATFTSTLGYPKGVFLSLSSMSFIHLIYQHPGGTKLDTFADDSTMFANHEDPTIASLNLQEHISSIEKCIFIQQLFVLNIFNMLHNLRFSFKNAVYFIMLHCLFPVLFTF